MSQHREGQNAIAHMHGENKLIDYSQIPRCVYTWPEAAAVGLTEGTGAKSGDFSRALTAIIWRQAPRRCGAGNREGCG
jgi:pyruvate/2-oxoglutarate dehydrogenase complex dihydrolipoamide dehydrogenase (E3) component